MPLWYLVWKVMSTFLLHSACDICNLMMGTLVVFMYLISLMSGVLVMGILH